MLIKTKVPYKTHSFVNPKILPHAFSYFPIQEFSEFDNQGSTIREYKIRKFYFNIK